MENEKVLEAIDLSLVVPTDAKWSYGSNVNALSAVKGSYFSGFKRNERILLRNLTFSLREGDRLGVIGSNGAGKTSLLKVLAGNFSPSSGRLLVNGNASALFNLHMGIQPSGTGMENIYLRGLQLGMSISEIREKMDEAVQFSGLEDDINRVFTSYSTGMRLRLVTAITLMPDPDILIMDEWIGSSDRVFAAKLSRRLTSYVDKCKCLIIASHNNLILREICTHGLYLKDGKSMFFGPIDEAIKFRADTLSGGES